MFDDKKDIYKNIEEKILKKGEVLYEEVEFLLREELKRPFHLSFYTRGNSKRKF
jgi:hypothetical protein